MNELINHLSFNTSHLYISILTYLIMYIYIHIIYIVVFDNTNIYLMKDLLTPSGANGLALNCRSTCMTSI